MESNKFTEYNYRKFLDVLSFVTKRDNREEIAEQLVKRYSNVENMFTADKGELAQLVGENTAVYIKVLSAVTSRRFTGEFEFGKPHNRAEIADYFKALFLTESVECVYVMLLDDDGVPVCTRFINRGTVSSSDVIPRRILEAVIDGGSHRVILAHNHPHGLAKASEDDIRLTGCVSDVLQMVGVKLEYHLVVAGDECDLVHTSAGTIIDESRGRR